MLQCESMATGACEQGSKHRWPNNVLEVCTYGAFNANLCGDAGLGRDLEFPHIELRQIRKALKGCFKSRTSVQTIFRTVPIDSCGTGAGHEFSSAGKVCQYRRVEKEKCGGAVSMCSSILVCGGQNVSG